MEETEYANSLVEVKEVLSRLSKEYYDKIPKDVIQTIEENKSSDYKWEYDDSLELKDQNISRSAMILLSFINEEYLLNEKQKEYMEKIYAENEAKLEEKKREQFNPDNIFKNKIETEDQDSINNSNTETAENTESKESTALIEVNDKKWYSKIVNFFKNIFRK